MHGAFQQDCILPPLKYFILKCNFNFCIYIFNDKKCLHNSFKEGMPYGSQVMAAQINNITT